MNGQTQFAQQKQQRGSMYTKSKPQCSDRRSLIGDMHNYIQKQPKWADSQIDLYQHRVSIDANQLHFGQCDKRTSMSTATTLSTDLGSHPLVSMYDNIEVDDPIEELSSQSDESQQSNKKKSKRKKVKEEPQQKFKTEMCKNWSLLGRCNYGKKCQFAHGFNELCTRPEVVQNNRYKSKLCKSYHQDNVCYYGARCQFIHESRSVDDIRKGLANQLHSQQIIYNSIDPILSKDHSRLKSLQSITNPRWNKISFKECIDQWTQQSKGLLIQLNLSSSSE